MFYFYEEMLIIVVAMLQYKYNNASLPKGQEKRRKRLKAVFALQKDPNPKPLLLASDQREIEGQNTMLYSVFCDILGAQNIAGECSLKIPYGPTLYGGKSKF